MTKYGYSKNYILENLPYLVEDYLPQSMLYSKKSNHGQY